MLRIKIFGHVLIAACATSLSGSCLIAADAVVPHNQEAPPGPALSPDEAIAKMVVPPGFKVELVASEPMLVNPVAMTFDERGRVWVTESFEYPRREPGPGRDRIKILEDVDGDGRMDKQTIFAEGLNIPSGIAIGHGGVWVANSPDILFLRDTNGDDKADSQEVIVTGFGRDDTHELPNSLTWGPDGWLYGLNGVFNPGKVTHQGKTHEFTCTLFRIHPKSKAFELFCEGTSNPWGVAFDPEGNAFVSACVIDHLWHLAEGAYYHRQGGPYPAHTWSLGSIVQHKHQKAAYCGIHYVSTPAYPSEWRDLLFMGNIHGNCVNVDGLERRKAGYFATPRPDFLTANDAWFMPVVQKEGPDGCLWVLDWYDRYHCYQDANRDPAGIDRAKGRLYRVTYQGTPPAKPFNMAKETDGQLITRLGGDNPLVSDLARRQLIERGGADALTKLEALVFDRKTPRETRLKALWTRVSANAPSLEFLQKASATGDEAIAAHCVRAAGNYAAHYGKAGDEWIASMAADPRPAVRLQVAAAIVKTSLPVEKQIATLLTVAQLAQDDPVPIQVVWQLLLKAAPSDAAFAKVVKHFVSMAGASQPGLQDMTPRLLDRVLGMSENRAESVANLLKAVLRDDASREVAPECLRTLSERVVAGELRQDELNVVKEALQSTVAAHAESPNFNQISNALATLAVLWGDAKASDYALRNLANSEMPEEVRGQMAVALTSVAAQNAVDQKSVAKQICAVAANDNPAGTEFRSLLIASLGRLNDQHVAAVVLDSYATLDSLAKSRAIDVLTQRASWAELLLDALSEKRINPSDVNQNQARQILALGNPEFAERLRSVWGVIRDARNPAREVVAARMRAYVRNQLGDAEKGRLVFDKVCGQCHKIYGVGQEVGPDLTGSGRNSFDQLVSNVFDPSLVIGAAYQARTLQTTDGRVITGLLVEDSPQRVSLKLQGGKVESVARANVEELVVSQLSLMPENLEEQLGMDQIADLFAFLVLDRPPSDPAAKRLGDMDTITAEYANSQEAANRLIAETAPGFQCAGYTNPDDSEVELYEAFRGRRRVLRTEPPNQQTPSVLKGEFNIPADKDSYFVASVCADRNQDCRVSVWINGQEAAAMNLEKSANDEDWKDFKIDLAKYAGQATTIELRTDAIGWEGESSFWWNVNVVSYLKK